MGEFKYRIRFCDNAFGDWVFTLITNEPVPMDEIETLIDSRLAWFDSSGETRGDYCPVNIMDDIVADHDGWRWEDGDDELIVVNW
jgi:hypothetical protein